MQSILSHSARIVKYKSEFITKYVYYHKICMLLYNLYLDSGGRLFTYCLTYTRIGKIVSGRGIVCGEVPESGCSMVFTTKYAY